MQLFFHVNQNQKTLVFHLFSTFYIECQISTLGIKKSPVPTEELQWSVDSEFPLIDLEYSESLLSKLYDVIPLTITVIPEDTT